MRVTIDIPTERIAQLFASAIEGGDPVTTACKGGWCNAIILKGGPGSRSAWWVKPKTLDREFLVEIVEIDDESTGHETRHLITRAKVAHGLAIMAQKFGHLFAQITADNIDAPCADIFLQCVLFGEEKYA